MFPGIFGDMFDFNGDGRLDAFEQSAELMFLDGLQRMERQDDMRRAGVDTGSLELMDEDERRQALEDAGFDPDDCDY